METRCEEGKEEEVDEEETGRDWIGIRCESRPSHLVDNEWGKVRGRGRANLEWVWSTSRSLHFVHCLSGQSDKRARKMKRTTLHPDHPNLYPFLRLFPIQRKSVPGTVTQQEARQWNEHTRIGWGANGKRGMDYCCGEWIALRWLRFAFDWLGAKLLFFCY